MFSFPHPLLPAFLTWQVLTHLPRPCSVTPPLGARPTFQLGLGRQFPLQPTGVAATTYGVSLRGWDNISFISLSPEQESKYWILNTGDRYLSTAA